jgi:ankyrin repeat protein
MHRRVILSCVIVALALAGCSRQDMSPLAIAARDNDVAALTRLLAEGASLDTRSGNAGWTPLMHAVAARHREAAQLLLERGADPNVVAGQGTALLIAASAGESELVATLLDHGANIRYRSAEGVDALVAALAGGYRGADMASATCRTDTVRVLREREPALALPQSLVGFASAEIARGAGCGEALQLLGAVN